MRTMGRSTAVSEQQMQKIEPLPQSTQCHTFRGVGFRVRGLGFRGLGFRV